MADFNKPNRDQEYVNALPETRDNQEALAKMFNGVSVLNIPVNSVQFAGGQFNLWDGGNWNVQAIGISGGGTGATTATGARTNLGVISEADGDNKYLKQASNLADLDDKATARTELQVLGIANNLSDVNDAATAFDNIKQDATTTSKGVVEKATDINMITGAANVFPDCETIKGWSESVQTIWTGTAPSVSDADILANSGFEVVAGTYWVNAFLGRYTIIVQDLGDLAYGTSFFQLNGSNNLIAYTLRRLSGSFEISAFVQGGGSANTDITEIKYTP